jgi:predicted AAA+ superfamily ATPase
VLVFGPRGTGKTSFLRRLVEARKGRVVDLLNKEQFRLYLSNPSRLFDEVQQAVKNEGFSGPILVDEIQLIPELLDEVHRAIEQFKPSVWFILTGSSARKLKSADANLLAGRALRVDFFPLDLEELGESELLSSLLQWGTLPEVVTTRDLELREAYLTTYVATYLQEEVQRESQVRNLAGFSRFLEIAASENGLPVNYKKIARAAGIADVTVKEYYQILQDTLVAHHIPAWSNSKREQLQLASKFYLFDNGVINALLGELRSEPRASTNRYGRLFENFIVGQLLQRKAKQDLPVKVYHYRTQASQEIDLILQRNAYASPVALEIKSSALIRAVDVPEVCKFVQRYPEGRALVICPIEKSFEDSGIQFYPVREGIEVALKWACE